MHKNASNDDDYDDDDDKSHARKVLCVLCMVL